MSPFLFISILYSVEGHHLKNSQMKKQLLVEPVLPKEKNIEKMPNQKWHQIISFIKSGVRIVGYAIIPFDLVVAATVLVFSELIGIIEELV